MSWLRRIVPGIYIAFVGAGLAFGTAGALNSGPTAACDGPGQIGSCPPFTPSSCAEACENMFGTTGGCDLNDCCTCAI